MLLQMTLFHSILWLSTLIFYVTVEFYCNRTDANIKSIFNKFPHCSNFIKVFGKGASSFLFYPLAAEISAYPHPPRSSLSRTSLGATEERTYPASCYFSLSDLLIFPIPLRPQRETNNLLLSSHMEALL